MSSTGYGAAGVAVLFFGSNFIPVKKVDAGDGVFFQWVMSAAIWTVGMAVQLERGSPQFEPLAMIGGMLWVIGNTMCVPVIQLIGLGLGVLVWGATNLIVGWMSGKFGFFGIDKESIDEPALNVVGALVCLSSLGAFFFVRPSTGAEDAEGAAEGAAPRAPRGDPEYGALTDSDDGAAAAAAPGDRDGVMERLKALPKGRRLAMGFGMAALAGCFFGLNFIPPTYLMNHHEDAFGRTHSKHALDYVFSHFCGIFLTATVVFVLYAAARRNRPYMPANVALPAFVCGAMWAVAQVSWFVANQELQFVVAFPIVTTGPGLVAAFFGVFFFHEIQGRRNFMWLGLAFALVVVGVSLISKSA